VTLKPERVAYWFLRLNGCLTIENFLLHSDVAGGQKTDADILAVRFPHRAELRASRDPLADHHLFSSDGRLDVIVAEVTTGPCKLNKAWRKRDVLRDVLDALGIVPAARTSEVGDLLAAACFYGDSSLRLRFVALGREKTPDLPSSVEPLLWREALSFIHERFAEHGRRKTHQVQWPADGKHLFDEASTRSAEDFIQQVAREIGVVLT